MRLRKTASALTVGVGALVSSAFYRRRSSRRIERVELYVEDGSMVGLADGSEEADALLALARDLLTLAG